MDPPKRLRRSTRIRIMHAQRQEAMEADKQEEVYEKDVYNPDLEPPEEPDPTTATVDELQKRIRVAVDPTENRFDVLTNGDLTGSSLAPEYKKLWDVIRTAEDRPFAIITMISRLNTLYVSFTHGRFAYQDWLFVNRIRTAYPSHILKEMRISHIANLLFWRGGAMAGHRQAVYGHWKFPVTVLLARWINMIVQAVLETVKYIGPLSTIRIGTIVVYQEEIHLLRTKTLPLFLVDNVLRIRRGTAIYPSLQQEPVLIQIPASATPPYSYDVVLSILLNSALAIAWAGGYEAPVLMIHFRNVLMPKFATKAHHQAVKRIEQYVVLNRAWTRTWRRVWESWGVRYQRREHLRRMEEEVRRPREQRGEVFSLTRPIKKNQQHQ